MQPCNAHGSVQNFVDEVFARTLSQRYCAKETDADTAGCPYDEKIKCCFYCLQKSMRENKYLCGKDLPVYEGIGCP